MKKVVFFAGILGALLLGVNANAEGFDYHFAPDSGDTGGNSYPTFSTAQGSTTGDNFIKVATTKYVDKQVDDANTAVVTLNTNANTANGTVTTNATDISAMETDRQVIPGSTYCANLDTTLYSGCGYISDETTASNSSGSGDSFQISNSTANYEWVKIAAEGLATAQITGGSGA